MGEQIPGPGMAAHTSQPLHLAYFISPHGFGHAARAAAVMDAVHAIEPSIHFEIFTTVPQWFFENLPADRYDYHEVLTDVGFVQTTPFRTDLNRTLQALEEFLPFNAAQTENIAGKVSQLGCCAVICDIAPLGIIVARKAGMSFIRPFSRA